MRPAVVTFLSAKNERVIARAAAAVAAVGARIDVEVLRVRTQCLPHRLRGRELRIWVRDPGLARERRIHARVHQVDRARRPVLPDEPVEDFGIDLIQAQQIRREMPADLRVVAGLDHESAGQLALHVHRPRVVLRKTARVFGLPVGDVAAVERFGNEERRLRPGWPAGVPVECGAGWKGRRGDVVSADEAVPVRASARVLDRSERARGTETSDRVGVHAVHSAQLVGSTPTAMPRTSSFFPSVPDLLPRTQTRRGGRPRPGWADSG